MNNFMGPMMPPPAAPGQPQKLEIRTNPNQRASFKNFMRQRTVPMMPMQQQIQPMPQPMSMMQPQPQMPLRMEMGGGVDIFDPMYSAPMMAPPAPMGFDDGGAVPPRRTDIRGQDHMLSYITPDEADILEALGGSGEAGPMGIPAFYGDFGDDRSQAGEGPSGGYGDDKDNDLGDMIAAAASDEIGDYSEDDSNYDGSYGSLTDNSGKFLATPDKKANRVSSGKQERDATRRATDKMLAGFTTDVNQNAMPGVSGGKISNMTSTLNPTSIDAVTVNKVAPTELIDDINLNLLGLERNLLSDKANAGFVPGVPSVSAPTSPEIFGMPDEYDNLPEGELPDYSEDRPGYTDGLPTGFFEDPSNFVDTSRGRFTTRLAGLTEAQRANMPGFMNTRDPVTGDLLEGVVPGIVDTIFGNPAQNAYGFEIDPDTKEVTGMINPTTQMPGILGAVTNIIGTMFPPDIQTTEDLFNTGVYTGTNSKDVGGLGDTPGPRVQAFNPCQPGYTLVNGVCTLIEQPVATDTTPNQLGGGAKPAAPVASQPVLVPSARVSPPVSGQMPVGYGLPFTGMAAPSVYSSALNYQNMLNQQATAPLRLQDGGSVSSRLDQAAGNFLKAIQPAA